MNPWNQRRTRYEYNSGGRLTRLTVENSATGVQETEWDYGVTLVEGELASNDLVRRKIYPDSTLSSDVVSFRYNRAGQMTRVTDQNGSVRQFDYDGLGRIVHDRVTTLGTGVDGAVLRISRGYNARGYLETVTSVNHASVGSGTVVNQTQAHGGAVDESGTPARPKVSYTYASGSANTVRLVEVEYPDGRKIGYKYGVGGTSEAEKIDNLADRVREIVDVNDSNLVLARYTRRGAKSTVKIEYAEPGVELTYLQQSGEPVGDAGDQYTGLDRFNRIEDIRWRKAGADLDRYQYGFDRAGNRRWRRNVVAAANGGNWDEAYEYDGLYQLTDLSRGNLNLNRRAIASIPKWQENLAFDSAGNWQRYITRVNGADDLDQTRTHNEANEITAIDGSSALVAYDGAGNMTTMPKVASWSGGKTVNASARKNVLLWLCINASLG